MITEDYTTQYIGEYDNPIYRGIPFLTNQYNGITEGFNFQPMNHGVFGVF